MKKYAFRLHLSAAFLVLALVICLGLARMIDVDSSVSEHVEGENGWTRSYNNLAAKYGFYFHVSNGSINTGIHGGSRTIAGSFGARVSGLLKFMEERHYDVKLSEKDFHRLTL